MFWGLIDGTGQYGGVDLRIDGSCPDNVLVGGQQASNSNNSTTPAALTDYSAANFPLSCGSHTLNPVAEPGPGSGLTQQQCNKAPSAATTTVKLSASPPVIVFFDGKDPHHVKVLVTTIGSCAPRRSLSHGWATDGRVIVSAQSSGPSGAKLAGGEG